MVVGTKNGGIAIVAYATSKMVQEREGSRAEGYDRKIAVPRLAALVAQINLDMSDTAGQCRTGRHLTHCISPRDSRIGGLDYHDQAFVE